MESGHVALVHYGEVPSVWHVRILLGHIQANEWQILTPDFDRYSEQLDHLNPDYTDFIYLGASTTVPARVPAHEVYGFAPLGPGTLAHHIQQDRMEANAERLNRGLPPLAPGGAGPAAAAPPPPAVAPWPGVLGWGAVAAGAPPVGAGAVAGPAGVVSMCWVCIESAGGYSRGDIVVTEPAVLPAGHVLIGEKAIVPSRDGSAVGCFCKRVKVADAGSYKLEDLRVLPVTFDAQGIRKREFAQAVAAMVEGVPQGGGLQLEGPATALNVLKALRDQAMTPTSFHEFWLRSAEIPRGDRSTYEHEVLSRILESIVTVDQLNVSGLQGVELLVRRLQVIREAHRISPTSPDYSSAEHFMGWRYRKGAHGVDRDLAQHVASELKSEAMILKESRKAKEEAQARRRNPGDKKGGGGGDQK